MQTIKQIEQT